MNRDILKASFYIASDFLLFNPVPRRHRNESTAIGWNRVFMFYHAFMEYSTIFPKVPSILAITGIPAEYKENVSLGTKGAFHISH